MKLRNWSGRVAVFCALSVLCGVLHAAEPDTTAAAPDAALEEYLAAADDSYGWQERRSGTIAGTDYVEAILTSQTWRDIPWRHQLFVIKPETLQTGAPALLLIDGGRWKDEYLQPAPEGEQLPGEARVLQVIANLIHAPVAVVRQVPHQPIFDGMVEDEAISYTFEQFVRSGDESWPLLLPMVKSAVRGMDAAQEIAAERWNVQIEQFLVTGASKRGWTTWLTAATDERVVGLAPMVIDVLNMGPQMRHQLATWGGFSEQIEDYTRRGIQQMMDTPVGRRLTQIVDPFAYREQLTQPKLILLGTNDRYWPLDALNLYWDDLLGEKYILYVPNNGHGLKDLVRVSGTIAALHRHVSGVSALPKLDWEVAAEEGGLILKLASDQAPQQVVVWTSSSATRDFREAVWSSTPLEADADGHYRFDLPQHAERYQALLGEAVYGGDFAPFYLSTNVRIDEPQPAGEAAGN